LTVYANESIGGETPSGIPFLELEYEIDSFVNRYIGTKTPGVAIVVVSNGEIIFSRGYGSYLFNAHHLSQHKAIGYLVDENGIFERAVPLYVPAYPAGAMQGIAEDLARFAIALLSTENELNPLFENQNTLSRIFTSSSFDPNHLSRYHGFLRYIGAFPTFGHAGSLSSGFSTNLAIVPEEQFGIVVLSNVDVAGIELSIMNLLLGNDFGQIQPSTTDLPNANNLEGNFVSARSMAGSFLEFTDYFGIMTVVAIDENTITIAGETLVQVEPYVFRMIETNNHMNRALTAGVVRFIMEDGQPVQIAFGNPMDMIAMPRAMFFVVASVVIAIGSAVVFLTAPIIMVIMTFINKKKNVRLSRFSKLNYGMVLCGTLLIINNVGLFLRFGLNPNGKWSALVPHIWINYLLVGVAVLTFIFSLLSLRSEKVTVRNKLFGGIATVVVFLLLFILHNWNFFSMI